MAEAKSATTENARNAEQGSKNSTADFGRLVAHHRAATTIDYVEKRTPQFQGR